MTQDYDPFDTEGQATTQLSEQEKLKLAMTNEVGDLKWLMGSKRGRRFMWRLLDKTHLFASSMTGNSQTFFLEGERNIGLKFMALVTAHCPEDYLKMLHEHQEQQANG